MYILTLRKRALIWVTLNNEQKNKLVKWDEFQFHESFKLTVSLELNTFSFFSHRMDHNFGNRWMHSYVQIFSMSDGSQKGFGGAAPRSSSDGPLRNHKTGLEFTISVSVFKSHFNSSSEISKGKIIVSFSRKKQ